MAKSIDLLNSSMITEAPSPLQNRFEYSAGNVIYAGYAIKGADSSDTVWTIFKYTYDTGNLVLKQTALQVSWDNRADESYS